MPRRYEALPLACYKGTREIRVILYAKADCFCATALADELSVEDTPAIEHDVIPLDGADVFQQGEIDSIGDRVALTQDPGDFARLPVDDARQDQKKNASRGVEPQFEAPLSTGKPALAIAVQARKLLIPRLVVAALRQGEAFFLRSNKPFAGVRISDDIG